jgi:site-specific DNA-methyltransferase (adenine-specific)
MRAVIYNGDSLDVLAGLADGLVDSIVTDPPYELGFMGRTWDRSGIAYNVELWKQCLRVLKPGGHLLAFGGTRTSHRMACAIEDAGFEIRDSIAWLYGSGFPKSLDVSKAIDKAACAERAVIGANPNHRPISGVEYEGIYQGGNTGASSLTAPATDDAKRWAGWGTALKPAHEPIVVARKPLVGTVAANVLAHGTGALNIDACRVAGDVPRTVQGQSGNQGTIYGSDQRDQRIFEPHDAGRWPANVVLDEMAAGELDEQSEIASRFFPVFRYQAKAPTRERPKVDGVAHATVKPLDLMRWLVRLVTPADGIVLEPFAGSGTTVEACVAEGMRCIGIEREATYLPLIAERMARAGLVAL